MKKSLNIGVFNPANIRQASPLCGDNVFAKGLEANGYQVTRFDYRSTMTPNEDILALSANNKYDIIWIGKAESVLPSTLAKVKSQQPGAIFCKWAADMRFEPTPHDMGHNAYVDYFFGTFGGPYLRKHLTKNMKAACSILAFTDSDFYKMYPVAEEFQTDVLWTGRYCTGNNLMRNSIISYLEYLEETSDTITRVFGPPGKLWLGYPEYLHYLNGAKIVVGVNSFNEHKYSSDRLGSVLTVGKFYLCHAIPGLSDCFTRGVDLDWFDNLDEFKDKVEYYLANPEERERIAAEGHKMMLKYFDYKPLMENILKVISTGKKNYPWDDFYTNI